MPGAVHCPTLTQTQKRLRYRRISVDGVPDDAADLDVIRSGAVVRPLLLAIIIIRASDAARTTDRRRTGQTADQLHAAAAARKLQPAVLSLSTYKLVPRPSADSRHQRIPRLLAAVAVITTESEASIVAG